MAMARCPQFSCALIDYLSLVDDCCQSQLRWQAIGPERSGRTNDRRHHYWPHHSGIFIFYERNGPFFHFSQAWKWDSILRLRRFDYNIYIRAEWPVAVNHGLYLLRSCSVVSAHPSACLLLAVFWSSVKLFLFLEHSYRYLSDIYVM